jgi:hypothetical protein
MVGRIAGWGQGVLFDSAFRAFRTRTRTRTRKRNPIEPKANVEAKSTRPAPRKKAAEIR